jgi:hypothetical protein
VVTDPVAKSTNPLMQLSAMQVLPPLIQSLDHSVLLPGSYYYLAQDDASASPDLGTNPGVDPTGNSMRISHLWQLLAGRCGGPWWFVRSCPDCYRWRDKILSAHYFRTCVFTAGHTRGHMISCSAIGFPAGLYYMHPITSSPSSSTGPTSASNASSSLLEQRTRTRLQNNMLSQATVFQHDS